MQVGRIDLDGTGSPAGLVTKILATEPNLPIPVPIEDLARQLDIQAINTLETEGFEGGLLTDDARSTGIILVNENAFPQRRRFTVGHELGHFLMPTHRPVQAGAFLCSTDDMRSWTPQETDRYGRMEKEANLFAALILMPPPALRREMQQFHDADLGHILHLAEHFCVSKETAARAYAQAHDETLAIIVAKDGRVNRVYKHSRFPRIAPSYGSPIPQGTLFYRANVRQNVASNIEPVDASHWLEHDLRERPPAMYEQIYPQQNGYTLVLLHIEPIDEDDESEERDMQKSWQVGFGRRGGR